MKNLHQNNRFVALLLIVSMLLIGSFSFANRIEHERQAKTIELRKKLYLHTTKVIESKGRQLFTSGILLV